jgi:3-mercaptopyruvate sulfurtransferase SseA
LEGRPVVTGGIPLWQVTRLGLSELANLGEAALPYLDNLDMRTFEHDRRTTDVRIALEWRGATEWQSERRLQHDHFVGHIPDALFRLGDNLVAQEMEVSLKRRDRYPDIFRSYLDHHPEVNLVWYVCGNEAIRDTVRQEAAQAPDHRRYYVSLWDDWRSKEEGLILENTRDRLALGELLA